MTPPSHDWSHGAAGGEPGPELLAAYLDGELEGRDDLAALRARLEDWIACHPEVRDEIQRQRRLRRLWEQTAPEEPTAAQWRAALSSILSLASAGRARAPEAPFAETKGKAYVQTLGLVAACLACVVLLSATFLSSPTQPWSVPSALDFYLPEDDPFPVARSQEVEVLQVAGADTGSLPIGRLPVQGELELVGHDDVAFSESNARVIFGVNSPMAWERLRDNEP